MPFMTPPVSTTGMTGRSSSAKIRLTVSWSISSLTRTTSVSMTSDTTARGSAANSSRNEHHPEQALLGVQDVGVVDCLDLGAGLAAQVADGLVDGHLRAQPGVARVHQAAGLVLGVGQQGLDLEAGRGVEQAEQPGPVVLGRRLDHVGGVVGLEQAHPLAALAGPPEQEELGLVLGGQADERVLGVLAGQEVEAVGPLVEVEERPGVAQLLVLERLGGAGGGARPLGLGGQVGQVDDLGVLAAALGDGADLLGDLGGLLRVEALVLVEVVVALAGERPTLAGGVAAGRTVVGAGRVAPGPVAVFRVVGRPHTANLPKSRDDCQSLAAKPAPRP